MKQRICVRYFVVSHNRICRKINPFTRYGGVSSGSPDSTLVCLFGLSRPDVFSIHLRHQTSTSLHCSGKFILGQDYVIGCR